MRYALRLISILLLSQSAAVLACLIPAYHFNDGTFYPILYSALATIAAGLTLLIIQRHINVHQKRAPLSHLLVVLLWLLLALFGALPYILTGVTPKVIDALFESMSGLTSTGATIFPHVQSLPPSILLWRSITQWVGGFGIVLLVLAVIPSLGINKFSLYTAEASQADNTGKLTSSTASTVRQTLSVYIIFTLLFIGLFLYSGMTPFDAVNITFTNISSGGFSIYDDSAASLTSTQQYILAAAMFLSGINFALLFHLLTFRFSRIKGKLDQFRFYCTTLFLASLFVTAVLHLHHGYPWQQALRLGIAQTASVISTTGTIFSDTNLWWTPILLLFLLLALCGGMAGSTSGGIKSMRVLILMRNVRNDLQRRLHPNSVHPVRLNGHPVPSHIIDNVMVIFIVYLLTILFGVLILMICGTSATESIGAVVGCVSGYGPGLGASGGMGSYAHFSVTAKAVCSLLMLAGRLECISILIVCFPSYYRS